ACGHTSPMPKPWWGATMLVPVTVWLVQVVMVFIESHLLRGIGRQPCQGCECAVGVGGKLRLALGSRKSFSRRVVDETVRRSTAEHGEDVVGVPLELGGTDAVDAQQCLPVTGADLGEGLQRGVGEHHERRNLFRVS